MSNLVDVKNLNVRFTGERTVYAINDLSFSLGQGEVLGRVKPEGTIPELQAGHNEVQFQADAAGLRPRANVTIITRGAVPVRIRDVADVTIGGEIRTGSASRGTGGWNAQRASGNSGCGPVAYRSAHGDAYSRCAAGAGQPGVHCARKRPRRYLGFERR